MIKEHREYERGQPVSGEIYKIEDLGAFLFLDDGEEALYHITQMTTPPYNGYDPRAHFHEGQRLDLIVLDPKRTGLQGLATVTVRTSEYP